MLSNILYSPLDIPLPPNINPMQFHKWAFETGQQNASIRTDKAHPINWHENYPWNMVLPYCENKWQNNFDVIFPELITYILDSFNIHISQLDSLMALPVKNEYRSIKFWHADGDITGRRFYLFNDDPINNPLLVRPYYRQYSEITKSIRDIRTIHTRLQAKEYICRLPNDSRAFYINNRLSAHTPYITTNSNRVTIAVFIKNEYLNDYQESNNHVLLRSIEKYSDYAIHWTAP